MFSESLKPSCAVLCIQCVDEKENHLVFCKLEVDYLCICAYWELGGYIFEETRVPLCALVRGVHTKNSCSPRPGYPKKIEISLEKFVYILDQKLAMMNPFACTRFRTPASEIESGSDEIVCSRFETRADEMTSGCDETVCSQT